jgi:hypothetical protein
LDVRLEDEAVSLLVNNRAKFTKLVALQFSKPSFVFANGLDRLREAGYPVVVRR